MPTHPRGCLGGKKAISDPLPVPCTCSPSFSLEFFLNQYKVMSNVKWHISHTYGMNLKQKNFFIVQFFQISAIAAWYADQSGWGRRWGGNIFGCQRWSVLLPAAEENKANSWSVFLPYQSGESVDSCNAVPSRYSLLLFFSNEENLFWKY